MRLWTLELILAATAVGCADPGTTTGIAPASGPPPTGSALVGTAPVYVATSPGALPGATTSAVFAINNQGVAVGVSDMTFTPENPFADPSPCQAWGATVYKNGQARSLHGRLWRAVGGNPCYLSSIATDVNENGEVVGTVWRGDEDETEAGFFWSEAAGLHIIRGVGPTFVTGINNGGMVVGYYDKGPGVGNSAFTWSLQGGLEDAGIGGPYIYSFPYDVNDAGTIAGCVIALSGPSYMAATWGSGGRGLSGEHCYTFGGRPPAWSWQIDWVLGGGINNHGAVVYGSTRWGGASNQRSAVGWVGTASAISDRGRIVGWRRGDVPGLTIAMSRGREEDPVVLPGRPSGGSSAAFGVNTCGDIAGVTAAGTWPTRAVVWKIAACDAATR